MTVKGPSGWRKLTAAVSTLSLKAHPALFAVIMGTGSVSNLLHVFPYGKGSNGLMIASLAFFFLNLILFCIFFFLALAKYVMHPDRWKAVIDSPVTSPYLGTFPMGLTTLLNVAVDVINIHFEFGGKGFLYFIWVVWWLDVIISALCCWVGVHAMMINQKHSLDTMSARWLLPVVTLIVASSSGGVLAPAIQKYSTYHCLITTVASVFLVAVGLTLALMVLTIYFARLIIHNIPPGHGVLSVFLPLGPTGQAGFAILLQGLTFKTILPYSHSGSSEFLGSSTVGDFLYLACISIAFILWSLATMWMIFQQDPSTSMVYNQYGDGDSFDPWGTLLLREEDRRSGSYTRVFFLNLGLYVMFVGVSVARLIRFSWIKIICNPGESLFLGTFNVGALTLIDVALRMN
ncbi:hypothetical protein H1R20_g14347, partial [Candolleomyces eurysporus]